MTIPFFSRLPRHEIDPRDAAARRMDRPEHRANEAPKTRWFAVALAAMVFQQALAADPGSVYGPRRNDPAAGIPKHAYSPFQKDPEALEPCTAARCPSMPGYVLVKLDTNVAVGRAHALAYSAPAPAPATTPTSSATLNSALTAHGITGLTPVFRSPKLASMQATVTTPSGKTIAAPDLTRWYRAAVTDGADTTRVVAALKATAGVTTAQPDYIRRPVGASATGQSALPTGVAQSAGAPSSDPLFVDQWHLPAAKVPEAWAWLGQNGYPAGGSRDIIVAVIDTGVDYNHPDLAANIWTNSLEIPGNGIDDDGNGFVDDVHGVNVTGSSYDQTGNPMDDHGHGTHVAGIIAAQGGNGIGGVGVAYNVKIMPIKAAQYSGVLAASDIAEGILYAVAQGADVINMSFGGYGRSQVEEDALAIAYGQAVLVAAAGNDGRANNGQCSPNWGVMYPAAYDWVLGVMARAKTADPQTGDLLAGFSNYDCIPDDAIEYELMAPGVDILSTLPNGGYTAWDGTSMAAPIVSGVAALVRTRYADKALYSSRFVMGQVASTGGWLQGRTLPGGKSATSHQTADAVTALTTIPKPSLSYLEHLFFDSTSIASANNANGRVDSGETIDLAITIKNRWGKADQVNVTLEAQADGAVGSDPCVTIVIGTVNYGAIGAFASDDNGLIRDTSGNVTGVSSPFRVTVSPTCPNDHLIPFKVTMSARNGMDMADATTYTSTGRFYVLVQRGRELPTVIDADIMLTRDDYWIVKDRTLIKTGVTVTISEGTQIQFGTTSPDVVTRRPSIVAQGILKAIGTALAPVELFTSESYRNIPVEISGNASYSYTKIDTPNISGLSFDHGYVTSRITGDWNYDPVGLIGVDSITNSIFDQVIYPKPYNSGAHFLISGQTLDANLFSGGFLGYRGGIETTGFRASYWPDKTRRNVFLNNRSNNVVSAMKFRPNSVGQDVIKDNAFLQPYINSNYYYWRWIFGNCRGVIVDGFWNGWERDPYCDDESGSDFDTYLDGNYWGTTSDALIGQSIWDNADDFYRGKVIYQPILTTPPESAWPFVVSVTLATAGDSNARTVGDGTATFQVTFNRDMDPTVQPAVSFGPAEPYTDYTVQPLNGGWADARTWKGTFRVTALTGDGYQILRVANARAASDPWLVTGVDDERFQFEVITSGAQSMNLQATGGSGFIGLTWLQDDFELLAGYNLYRSTAADGTFTRVNSTIIPGAQKSYQDVSVAPGVTYFYKFTVVKTDFTESGFSNITSAAALDGIPPTIIHTPITSAQPGNGLSIFATIADNIAVTGASLFYRTQGTVSFTERTMTKSVGDRWSATIAGSAVVPPGLDYYITATDGVSTVYFGRPENPYPISVVDAPVLNTLSPLSGPAGGGTVVTLAGSNFKAGATVQFGGAEATNVTVVSANQITATAPAHFPAAVDVVVRNSDGRTSTLLRGFTFVSTDATVTLPTVTANQNDVATLSINATNLTGLIAADITVSFNASIIRPRGVTLGTLTAGWALAQNIATSGQVTLSLAGTSSASGSGSLASLEFDVIGSPGQSTALTITQISLNDGAIAATTATGGVDVQQVYGISGSVRNWKQGGAISGAQLALTGDRSHNAASGTDGTFALTGVAPGSYTLRPSRTGDDSAITAYDAAMVLQHVAGIAGAGLTGNAAIAADVDKSGAIGAMDASYILQRAAGLIELPFPGAGVTWDFAPSSRSVSLSSANVTGQDFTGTLLGDVSGSWVAPAGTLGGLASANIGSTSPTTTTSVLVQGDESDPSLGVSTSTISLSTGGNIVLGVDLVLAYDPAKAQPLAVGAIGAASNWLVSSNLARSGEIRIAMASATAITGDAAVLNISFKLLQGADAANVQLRDVRVNETVPTHCGYRLRVTKAGTGSGSVTDLSGAINCGSTCSAYFNAGQVITLTATPSTNSAFSGWSGACSGTGSCIVRMDSAHRVTANFAAIPVAPLATTMPATSVTATGATLNGSISSNGGDTTVSFQYGPTTIYTTTLDATPGSLASSAVNAAVSLPITGLTCGTTYHFLVVATNSAGTSSGEDLRFVTAPCSGLTVKSLGSGIGTVTSNPEGIICGSKCNLSLPTGTNVTLTATNAFYASAFAHWGGACAGTQPICTFKLSGTTEATATFTYAGTKGAFDSVQDAYIAYYGRPADPQGRAYWAGRTDIVGRGLDPIIGEFGYSPEYTRRYGTMTPEQLVDNLYVQVLARHAEQGGLDYWVGEFKAGRRTLPRIAMDILNGVQNGDVTTVNNKRTVANYFSDRIVAGCPYGTEQDGLDVLGIVDGDPATVTEAIAIIDRWCGP